MRWGLEGRKRESRDNYTCLFRLDLKEQLHVTRNQICCATYGKQTPQMMQLPIWEV